MKPLRPRAPAAPPLTERSATRAGNAPPERVLCLAPKECWPPDAGAKVRNFHLACELARRARVTFLGFADDGLASGHGRYTPVSGSRAAAPHRPAAATHPPANEVEPFCEQVVTVPREGGYTLAQIIRGAVGRTPLPVLNYHTTAMQRALARLLAEHDFDVVQVEYLPLASYLPVIDTARRRPLTVCDWHNIDSEILWRYSERVTSPTRRLYARMTARRMEAFERRGLRRFDAHLVVSTRDRDRLLEFDPGARVHVIENGVDVGYYSDDAIERVHAAWLTQCAACAAPAPDTNHCPMRRRILFVGSMDYHANVDAVLYFARETWPGIHSRHPGLIFTVVGRRPAAEVRRLAQLPGVEVTGTVEDVRPYYREAVAAVVPLRIGGGSRLKILEAMAAGVPVVSTRLGAEGLAVRDGENILLTDAPEALRAALVGLCEHPTLRRELAEAGRGLVRDRYDWSAIGAQLWDLYQELAGCRQAA